MSNQTIIDYFRTHADEYGVPDISNSDWLEFIETHDKDEVKNSLAEYITTNNIPFPKKQISKQNFVDLFLRFCETSMLSEYKRFDKVSEKVDYKYKYESNPLGVLDKSHVYNSVSNYFQQENRMRCGSHLVSSPWDIWHDRKKLEKMNWHFWRRGALGKTDVNDRAFRSAFRIGTYTATQFRPSVAKALYEKHKAKNVLDTSCGWGDRLAGFYATPNAIKYVGCDPNPEVYETYKKQCVEYERLLGHTAILTEYSDHFTCVGKKLVKIYNLPSEDVDWSKHKDEFDFYFTSPPYYATEKYGAENKDSQSWNRYPEFNKWKNDFFFRVNRMVWDTLRSDAYMMINIIEPSTEKGSRLNLCDDMVDEILTYPDSHYIGKIGMRMQARPHKIIDAEKNSVFIEPIWVFRKNNQTYIEDAVSQLFTFG